jgi:hypothetical protein
MRVAIISGTAPFPEMAPETDEEGRYQIGGVAPGTFEVAVHDRDGKQIGLDSVVVRSGETAALDFSISGDETIEAGPPLPPRPVMRLHYADQVYEGSEGSYCWPDFRADDGSVVGICADKIRWGEVGDAIPVEEGSTLVLEVEAEGQAQALSAALYEVGSDTQERSVDLGPEATLLVDLPEGIYNRAVFGRWPEGDLAYEFRLEVRPGSSTTVAPPAGPGPCEKYLDLLVSFDEGRTEERAVVTSYQCMNSHVDSTGRGPSHSPSATLPAGSPLRLRLAAETQPTVVDARLYPEAGVAGYFFSWPEELPDGVEPVDTLRPTTSVSFQYLPQQPPGDYSLVIRAAWDGPIVVFYATSFSLE